MTATQTLQASYRAEAIRRLAAGFGDDFAEFCAGHDSMHELMLDLAMEFIQSNIPITDEDATHELGTELIMGVTVRTV